MTIVIFNFNLEIVKDVTKKILHRNIILDKLVWGWENIILFWIRFQRYNFFVVSLQFLRELNNIFHIKDFKKMSN